MTLKDAILKLSDLAIHNRTVAAETILMADRVSRANDVEVIEAVNAGIITAIDFLIEAQTTFNGALALLAEALRQRQQKDFERTQN